MAPERIDPQGDATSNYDVRSDVWSLGISLIEVAAGSFPYEKWGTPFDQIKRVVLDPPPKVPSDKGFSHHFQNFVAQWYHFNSILISNEMTYPFYSLQKEHRLRPSYNKLLEHPFLSALSLHGDNTLIQWEDVKHFVKALLEVSSSN
jgi:serine/threonine protein kinase